MPASCPRAACVGPVGSLHSQLIPPAAKSHADLAVETKVVYLL